LVGGVTQERAAEFDRMFDSALAITKQSPPGLLPVSLIDAVRIALSQNTDLRLSAEDAQSARGRPSESTPAAMQQSVGAYWESKTISSFVSEIILRTRPTLQKLLILPELS